MKIDFKAKKGFICDMDGVIYLGNQLLPGVAEIVTVWYSENCKSSIRLPKVSLSMMSGSSEVAA